MADKILKVSFSGVSTLYPGPPLTRNEESPKEAFVLMAANYTKRQNDWNGDVEPHFTFVHVPVSHLKGLVPEPDDRSDDNQFNIYYLDNARVSFDPKPHEELHYYVDPHHDLAERPGSDDVANEHDIRWLASLRRFVDPQLRSSLSAPGPEVANLIELPGGTVKANFACKSEQEQTFQAFGQPPIAGSKRVLASEFFIEMKYPETTRQVKLRQRPLRRGEFMSGISLNELTLRWPENGDPIVVRMGNDTKEEARMAASLKRCNARIRSRGGEPVLRPRDNDFFLHYELLNLPSGTPRPLPQAGPHQTGIVRCKGGGI